VVSPYQAVEAAILDLQVRQVAVVAVVAQQEFCSTTPCYLLLVVVAVVVVVGLLPLANLHLATEDKLVSEYMQGKMGKITPATAVAAGVAVAVGPEAMAAQL
jgi:hypothetical protein